MTPEHVIDDCVAQGIRLRVEQGRLKASPPPSQTLLDSLRQHRDAVIARLGGRPPMPPVSPMDTPVFPAAPANNEKAGARSALPLFSVLPQPHSEMRATVGVTGGIGGYSAASRDACQVLDPAELAERIAILEVAGTSWKEAETQALREAGLTGWEKHAVALGSAVRATIAVGVAVPPPGGLLGWGWDGLRSVTEAFLASAWWPLACRRGWSLLELFGAHPTAPVQRIDCWGLITSTTLSALPPGRLAELTGEGAVFVMRSGGRLSWPRFRQGEPAVLWWELAGPTPPNTNVWKNKSSSVVLTGGAFKQVREVDAE